MRDFLKMPHPHDCMISFLLNIKVLDTPSSSVHSEHDAYGNFLIGLQLKLECVSCVRDIVPKTFSPLH